MKCASISRDIVDAIFTMNPFDESDVKEYLLDILYEYDGVVIPDSWRGKAYSTNDIYKQKVFDEVVNIMESEYGYRNIREAYVRGEDDKCPRCNEQLNGNAICDNCGWPSTGWGKKEGSNECKAFMAGYKAGQKYAVNYYDTDPRALIPEEHLYEFIVGGMLSFISGDYGDMSLEEARDENIAYFIDLCERAYNEIKSGEAKSVYDR